MKIRDWRTWILVGSLVVALGVGIVLFSRARAVPGRTLIEVDLDGAVAEHVPDDPVARVILRRQLTVRDLVDALERAGGDERVLGLIARLGNAPLGLGRAQEIRDAVVRFREKGKLAIAFAETFGELSPANASYYLATGFDEIHLQPSGDVNLTGIRLESPFIKGTLEKIGVRYHGDHRHEYKNALNMYTESRFTPPHREAMEAVKQSVFDQLVRGIAERRRIPADEVRRLVDRGPFLGKEALDARLVDRLSYRDEAYEAAKKRAGEGVKLLSLRAYLERAGRPHRTGKTLALVYAVGGVTRGKSRFDPIQGGVTMGSDTVAGALRKAIQDEDVKAIVLRIDSPGGSYVASDAIWRETVRARQAGKPVIATMGTVAASGGYFVAMAADKIVAHPGTITGSIGVLAGKPVATAFFEKIGLSFDHVQAGANAGMFSFTEDYTPLGWARLQALLDRIYVDFTAKVAEGRKLDRGRVHEIARGRIWTGEQAKRLGLVDELGGLPTAIRLAKQAAGIPDAEKVRLRVFPERRKLPFEELLLGEEEPESSEAEAAVAVLRRTLEAAEPVLRRLRVLRGALGERLLEAPDVMMR